ncbi:MAG: hypothetical protein J6O71_04510 [Lachnospiraceae bacterium]|nr:hypothetical protein [Lachnospiraceae bacterium]
MKKLKVTSLLLYIWENIEKSNFIWYLIFTGIVTLVGMLVPYFNERIFSDVISSRSIQILVAISVFMIFSSVSRLLFDKVKEMLLNKISVKLDLSVEAATMMRILSLPPAFFRNYSAGELSNRAEYISNLVDILLNTLVSTGITSIFSLVYIGQVFVYAPALVAPALTVTIANVALSVTTSFYQMRITREQMEYEAKESGIAYAFTSLGSIAFSVAQIKPTLDMARPLMEAEHEVAENKRVVERLSGGIELNNITFSYSESSPLVLDNLSLKITPGQYVAIVGRTPGRRRSWQG